MSPTRIDDRSHLPVPAHIAAHVHGRCRSARRWFAYGVTVSLNNGADYLQQRQLALTIDSTAPVVTVTAPESAENGDTVMISATVTEAGTVSSVTADVSALDSTQTAMVALDDGS